MPHLHAFQFHSILFPVVQTYSGHFQLALFGAIVLTPYTECLDYSRQTIAGVISSDSVLKFHQHQEEPTINSVYQMIIIMMCRLYYKAKDLLVRVITIVIMSEITIIITVRSSRPEFLYTFNG